MTDDHYRVTVDKDACDGIFACLTRDPRFVEDGDGLATVDPAADPAPPAGSDEGRIRHEDGAVIATFADDRVDEARQAAAACPPNAITVETVTPDGGEPPLGAEDATDSTDAAGTDRATEADDENGGATR